MVKPVEASEMPVPTEVMALQNNHFTKYFINITNGKIGENSSRKKEGVFLCVKNSMHNLYNKKFALCAI